MPRRRLRSARRGAIIGAVGTAGSARTCGACGQALPPALRSWEMFIPIEPPSQNVLATNKGASRHRYRKLRDDYTTMLRGYRRLYRIPEALGRRRVFIDRVFNGRGRAYDRGNLVGGCKPLLDALVAVGLLVDDAPTFLEDHYSQRRGDEPGVVVRLEELAS